MVINTWTSDSEEQAQPWALQQQCNVDKNESHG